MISDRSAGVLLHPTSLPGPFGIGDLGPEAFRYVDWLASCGVRWWQILPLNAPGDGQSPYAARSTFALNPLLISPELLVEDGLLEKREIEKRPDFPAESIDFGTVVWFKDALLRKAFDRFRGQADGPLRGEFKAFRQRTPWVADYALFAALKDAHDSAGWFDWPKDLALRKPAAVKAWQGAHAVETEFHEFVQFLVVRQWTRLRRHANGRGVRVFGDMPLYVALDSAEVWANRGIFRLDKEGRPLAVAGVPPDYFNEDGQLWGNPLYDWKACEKEGYRWWIERIAAAFETVDALRIDHFRAFSAFWEIPSDATTARTGKWVEGPGSAVFDALAKALGPLALVAEDLGDIDPKVHALRDGVGMPGMAVLQFGWSPHTRSGFVPYNHRAHQVVYTGTHDNNTSRGWYETEATDEEKDFLRRYLSSSGHEPHWDLIRAALASVAGIAVVPQQDLAGIGAAGRMNVPGRAEGNWTWRMLPGHTDEWIRNRFAELIWLYGRHPDQNKPTR